MPGLRGIKYEQFDQLGLNYALSQPDKRETDSNGEAFRITTTEHKWMYIDLLDTSVCQKGQQTCLLAHKGSPGKSLQMATINSSNLLYLTFS